MNLSPKQKEVIRLMREGWELQSFSGFGNHIRRSAHLRKAREEEKEINYKTLQSLSRMKLVRFVEQIWATKHHTLTDLGKTIEI